MLSQRETRMFKELCYGAIETNKMIREFGHRFSATKHTLNTKLSAHGMNIVNSVSIPDSNQWIYWIGGRA